MDIERKERTSLAGCESSISPLCEVKRSSCVLVQGPGGRARAIENNEKE